MGPAEGSSPSNVLFTAQGCMCIKSSDPCDCRRHYSKTVWNERASSAATSLLGDVSATLWILSSRGDLDRNILSSSVKIPHYFTISNGLSFAHPLSNNFKWDSFVGCDTLCVRTEVRQDLLPHLLFGVQVLVWFTCNQRDGIRHKNPLYIL